jgi:hypothetical protein
VNSNRAITTIQYDKGSTGLVQSPESGMSTGSVEQKLMQTNGLLQKLVDKDILNYTGLKKMTDKVEFLQSHNG